MDIYQERYLAHQERKRKTLAGDGTTESYTIEGDIFSAIEARVSQRIFNDESIIPTDLAKIYESIRLAPSSCNRQAILIKPITLEPDRQRLAALLVGGKDWLFGAKVILLLFADMIAYKSPAEIEFMPYLDAGIIVESVYLVATVLGIGVCYVNPNIRKENRTSFDRRFNSRGLQFCGAIALGMYDRRIAKVPKRRTEEMFYYYRPGV